MPPARLHGQSLDADYHSCLFFEVQVSNLKGARLFQWLTDIGRLFDKLTGSLRSRQLYIYIALHRTSVVLADLWSYYILPADITPR